MHVCTSLTHSHSSGVTHDYHKAFKLFTTATELGSSAALNNVAHCTLLGHGTTPSSEKAFELFVKSALMGAVVAQFNLGWSYEFGRGCAIDFEKAMDWYKLAAAQGHTDAMLNVRRLVTVFSHLKKRGKLPTLRL
jgi:TPR repeat protein